MSTKPARRGRSIFCAGPLIRKGIPSLPQWIPTRLPLQDEVARAEAGADAVLTRTIQLWLTSLASALTPDAEAGAVEDVAAAAGRRPLPPIQFRISQLQSTIR